MRFSRGGEEKKRVLSPPCFLLDNVPKSDFRSVERDTTFSVMAWCRWKITAQEYLITQETQRCITQKGEPVFEQNISKILLLERKEWSQIPSRSVHLCCVKQVHPVLISYGHQVLRHLRSNTKTRQRQRQWINSYHPGGIHDECKAGRITQKKQYLIFAALL